MYVTSYRTSHGTSHRTAVRAKGAGPSTTIAAALVMLLLSGSGLHGQRPPARDSAARADSAKAAMKATPAMEGMPGMTSGTTSQRPMAMVPDPLGVSMDRLGSGTTWIPDAVALPRRQLRARSWDLMLHGFAFGEEDVQSGPRGTNQLGSLNWGMLMASHELAGGRFQARTMLSLDALTVTTRGYPLLLQSGETYHDAPIHDRQHPHDFWMELGAMYDRPVTKSVGLSLYAAPSGEPALGPVAFMHRPSAMDIPSAPIGHHWEDASHITFGVVTAAVFTHDVRVEGSVFNGRDADEERWGFDPITLDSYAGRVSYNPTVHWALNASYGYVKSPDALTPAISMHRMTASAMYGKTLGADGQLATTYLWGANRHSDRPGLSHAALAESEAVLDKSNTLVGRVEFVQKTGEDLVLDTPQFQVPPTRSFNVGALSLGYIREILPMRAATLGLGAMGTLNVVPQSLQPAYGSRTPLGAFVFLRVRPIGAKRDGMSGMPGMSGLQKGGIR
jgi:hypothetical protein